MWRLLGLAALFAICFARTASGEQGYYQQDVRYRINARLDTKQHRLTGSQTVFYKNNSPDTLRTFFLHLYPNAYASKDTPLMKDVRRRFNYTLMNLPKRYRGYLDITNVEIDGRPVTPQVQHTIASMAIPKPLAPGDSMIVTLDFEEKIRRHAGRAGYRGKQYDMAQWYPRVVVYDTEGWHDDQFRLGEFFGEFGRFDVTLEVPENYVLAATGVPVEGDPGWSLNPVDGKREKKTTGDVLLKTVRFVAENVHDFAWNASPNFAVQDTVWNGVQIRSFFNQGNKAWQDSTLAHGLRAVEWLTERVGDYPYPQVSIVQSLMAPGRGMEYPMLVMDGSASEPLVFHEIGHIYFYGALGNDEREEAWLDEGLTTFQTDWYQIEKFGPYGDKGKWNWYERLTPQFTILAQRRNNVFKLARLDYGERVATRAEEFKNSYRAHVYDKPSLFFFALKYVVGDDEFEQILKRFFSTWKFKHVNAERFEAVCEEVTGRDLSWFFEQWLYTRKMCDYRLGEVKSTRRPAGDGYDVYVRIDRLGEIVMPVEIEFTFKNGAVEKSGRLDGRLRTIEHTFQFPEKPERAALNPENEILDINMTDNFDPQHFDQQIDWPNNFYYPEHAYQFRHRPYLWYNDIDGARVGYHVRGSLLGFYRRFQLGLYYGVKSEVVDFSTSYAIPTRTFGMNGDLEISGYKLEGRADFTFSLAVKRRKDLVRPPTQKFTYEFNYHQLFDSAYVIQPQFYQEGIDIAPIDLTYQADPQLDILKTKNEIGFRLGRKWFGADWKYSRFYLKSNVETRRLLVPFDAGMRVFLGIVGGDMPTQQKFNLAGANVLEQETVFFLRSPGAIPPEINYLMPGDGNLRGYAEGTFPVNQLLTANFKIGKEVPLLSRPRKSLWGEVKLSAFADVGTVFDSTNPVSGDARIQSLVDAGALDRAIFDAGLGLRLRRDFPFWRLYLRYDVPFYVNQPEINGEREETKYRYLFSLMSVFSFSLD